MIHEDFDYKYATYLAEQQYYSDLDNIMNTMITEDTISLGYVNESLKDTVQAYISKVSVSAQKSWNKFKVKVNNKKDIIMLNKFKRSVAKFKQSDFFIDNYPIDDITGFSHIKLIPLNYQQMKPFLHSRESFMKQYYPSISFDNKVSVKKGIKDHLTRAVQPKFQVTKQFLVEKLNFNLKTYYALKTELESDMEILNKSNEAIIQLSGSILPTDESVNFKSVYESILLEAPTNPLGTGNAPKMSFSDSSGKKLTPNASKKNLASSSYLKNVQVYMDCMTGIISGKMTVLTEEYQNNMRILTMVHNRSGAGIIMTDRDGNPKTSVEI